MDKEERRIRDMYRGHPDYYRKLHEYQLTKASLQAQGTPTSILRSGAEPPPVTQFYRKSQVKAAGNRPPVQSAAAPAPTLSAGAEPVSKRDAPVPVLRQAPRAESPPVTDFYRQLRAQPTQKQTSDRTSPDRGAPSHVAAFLKSDDAESAVADKVASAEGAVQVEGYYLQLYKEQIRAGRALPYVAAKAMRDRQDRSRGLKRRNPASPGTPAEEEGI